MRDKMNRYDRQHQRDIYKGPKFESGFRCKKHGLERKGAMEQDRLKMKTRKCKRRRNRGGEDENRWKTKKNAVGRGKLSLSRHLLHAPQRGTITTEK